MLRSGGNGANGNSGLIKTIARQRRFQVCGRHIELIRGKRYSNFKPRGALDLRRQKLLPDSANN